MSSAAAVGVAARSAAPTCATTSRSPSTSRPKAPKPRFRFPRQETCETCNGNGAAPGSKPTTCPQCQGRGQLRYQQGFFTVARTCGQCRGTGSVIAKPCATCRGSGRVQKERKLTVRIPAGIATGQRLRLTGEGEAGPSGGPPGDLYVVIHVQEHPFFQRDGNDLHCEIPLHFTTLALGGEIRVPTLDGRGAVHGPEGTQTGTIVPAARQGHARRVGTRPRRPESRSRSITPKKLTKDQRKLLEQLATTLPKEQFEPTPLDSHEDKGLFDRVKDIFG